MQRLLAISLGLCLLTACASIETVKEARGQGLRIFPANSLLGPPSYFSYG